MFDPDTMTLDAPPPAADANTPTAALVEVLLSELCRRMTVAAAAVRHLGDDARGRCEPVLTELGEVARRVADLPRRAAAALSTMVLAVQRLTKRIAELEQRVWTEIVYAIQEAEAAGAEDAVFLPAAAH